VHGTARQPIWCERAFTHFRYAHPDCPVQQNLQTLWWIIKPVNRPCCIFWQYKRESRLNIQKFQTCLCHSEEDPGGLLCSDEWIWWLVNFEAKKIHKTNFFWALSLPTGGAYIAVPVGLRFLSWWEVGLLRNLLLVVGCLSYGLGTLEPCLWVLQRLMHTTFITV